MLKFENINELNELLTNLCDVFVYTLNDGLAGVDLSKISFTNKYTKELFIGGFDLIQQGIINDLLKIVLEKNLTVILYNNKNISEYEIFELLLIKELLPTFQTHDFSKLLDYQSQLCSPNIVSINEEKFEKFII